MNEEQSRQLAGVLGGAIDQVVRDANSLRIRLLDLKALEAKERNDFGDLPLLSYLQVELPDGDGCYVPTGESEELDRVAMLASRADSNLRAGDLGEAVSLVLQCHQTLFAETTRLLGIELGKKIDALNEAQRAKQAPHRAVKKWVQDRWEAEGDARKSPPTACSIYLAILEQKGMVNHETGKSYSVETILGWLRERARTRKLKSQRAMKNGAKKHH